MKQKRTLRSETTAAGGLAGVWRILHCIMATLQREHLLTLSLIILVIVLVSGLAITLFEPGLSYISGIWWAIVTLTTVGYGDISPSTIGGRVVAIIIMFFGIGILGTLSANLATMMISHRIRENKGMGSTSLESHIILCEWNHRARAVLRELRADNKTARQPVVLIADIAEKPVADPRLIFIAGAVDDESLEKANLKQAETVIVIGDQALEPTARDAKAVLTTLTIESLNPDVYTIVEIVNGANEQHCRRAPADEVIVGSELSSHMLATAAIDHGMSGIVTELLSARFANKLYAVPVPKGLVGRACLDAMIDLKQAHQATLLGLQKGRNGPLLANPEPDHAIAAEDCLVVIARERPRL